MIQHLIYTVYAGSDCTDGQVRLVNGTSSSNGRVEYCFEGGWSALCGMSAAASTAICRSLGFNTSCMLISFNLLLLLLLSSCCCL